MFEWTRPAVPWVPVLALSLTNRRALVAAITKIVRMCRPAVPA